MIIRRKSSFAANLHSPRIFIRRISADNNAPNGTAGDGRQGRMIIRPCRVTIAMPL